MKEEKDIASMDFAEDLSFVKCKSGWDVQLKSVLATV